MAHNEWTKTCSLTHLGVPLHAEQTKVNPWFIWVPTNSLILWYFPIPIVPPLFTRSAAFHSLRWWLLSVFQEPSDSSLVDGGPWYFADVCVCLCVGVWEHQCSFHWSVLGFGLIGWGALLKRCCRFHLTTATASLSYVHAFVCAYMHSLSGTQKQDPTSLHLLTKPILWKSCVILHKSPYSPFINTPKSLPHACLIKDLHFQPP